MLRAYRNAYRIEIAASMTLSSLFLTPLILPHPIGADARYVCSGSRPLSFTTLISPSFTNPANYDSAASCSPTRRMLGWLSCRMKLFSSSNSALDSCCSSGDATVVVGNAMSSGTEKS